MTKTKVALVRTSDRHAGVRRSIELLGVNPVKGKEVLVKPNFNTADPAPGSTDLATLEELILKLREMGARSVLVAERSGPPLTADVVRDKGYDRLFEKLGVRFIDLDENDTDHWVEFRPQNGNWPEGFVYPKVVRDAECIVATCCLKTHGKGGVISMALKLGVGLVPRRGYDFMGQMHGSPNMRKMITEINLCYRPELIVMDGVDVFVDGGPDQGVRKKASVFVTGTDRVAVDAVGVAVLKDLGSNEDIMSKKIFDQEQIARAVELGLGVDSPDKIELVTDDEESAAYAARLREILDQG